LFPVIGISVFSGEEGLEAADSRAAFPDSVSFVPSFVFGGLPVLLGAVGVMTVDAGNVNSGILSFVGEDINGSVLTVVLCSVKGGDTGATAASFSLLFPHADNISTAIEITNPD
jgi:hypothetical protein